MTDGRAAPSGRELSAALAERMELRAVFDGVLRMLADRPGVANPYLTLADPHTGEIRIEESAGLTPEQLRTSYHRFGEGIVGQVIESGQTCVVHGSSPTFLNRLRRSEPEGISFVCAPIKLSGGQVVGTLSVDRQAAEPRELQVDVELVEVVAEIFGRAIELRRAAAELRLRTEAENRRLQSELRERFHIANLVGTDKSMLAVYDKVARVAPSNTTVLLRGESGTGKELVARAIHFASTRAAAPFVAINCAALPEAMLESELFGHERGAFTGAVVARKGRFELASGGSVFLDEIGELSPTTQVKLLRVLQERSFERLGGTKTIVCDVRVLAATHANLEQSIADGRFREDLYYRLNVFDIVLPALRDRRSDILELANFFVDRYGRDCRPPVTRISRQAAELLRTWDWPGNVRELQNCIERAVLLAIDGVIRVEHLPPTLRGHEPALGVDEDTSVIELGQTKLDAALELVESRMLAAALATHGGNRAAAARALGISERRMGLRVRKYKLE
ncbi:Response regulator of zinc sigma-54-dependent two-component system [Enhygromyxa salina]|uniref:Response regulator of zinc sigma-54-dependent two-component system n=1 Tax=Enhygromyxa salina TaxID=215803 RepID=A0A0C2DHG8_9BACT|nr:sigma 54-interacting transcriptional regulator [Enhygromyxa salina]KIG19142.1 Response regulator of zinc sigma-54-dependent two-component system [Enhygromyxa salina]